MSERSGPTKDREAFRTISEVASELNLPQHVLRFWESKFAQVKPLQRGGGRRYYRLAEVDLLRAIRNLLYDHGYTIRGVQRILKEQGAKSALLLAGSTPSPDREPTTVGMESDDDEVMAGHSGLDPASQEPLKHRLAGLLREVEACSAVLRSAGTTP